LKRIAAAAFAAIVACGPGGGPASVESCKAGEACHAHGRCAFDQATEKCVVGSDADCKSSRACQKDGLCFKEGTTCVKRE
jgi:hypothetical protein